MTASSPQQEAEECRQTSSTSRWISSLSRASPVGRQAPETGGAGNRVAICSPDCRSYRPTGQTTCWDSSGAVIPCAGTGQDGDMRAGVPLSYTDNGDGAITDNNTGLVWGKLSWDGSIHDVFNFYKWGDAFAVHVATLNSMRFAGHADWRLPNAKELLSIVNYENFFDVFRADIAPPS